MASGAVNIRRVETVTSESFFFGIIILIVLNQGSGPSMLAYCLKLPVNGFICILPYLRGNDWLIFVLHVPLLVLS